MCFVCRAKGAFRNKKIKPLVGDRVHIYILSCDTGIIEYVSPRRNKLLRPALSNVDLLIAVVSVKNPTPDFKLIDKLLVNAAAAGISAVVCINKTDLDSSSSIAEIYRDSGCKTVSVSAASGEGIEELLQLLDGRISVLAGNSGVGKTSILNCLGFSLETGSISRIRRGRHTTRHTELYPLPSCSKNSYIADTPGFSVLCSSLSGGLPLASYFPELRMYTDCKFDDCIHLPSSSGCKVTEAVRNGEINSSRYRSYLSILEELEDNNRCR